MALREFLMSLAVGSCMEKNVLGWWWGILAKQQQCKRSENFQNNAGHSTEMFRLHLYFYNVYTINTLALAYWKQLKNVMLKVKYNFQLLRWIELPSILLW